MERGGAMLEIIRRFTEDTYCDKETIMNTFDTSNANIIWDETKQYRAQFDYPLSVDPHRVHITMCRKVMFMMMECERNLYHYSRVLCKGPVMHKEEDAIWSVIALHYRMDGQVAMKQWIKESLHRLHISHSLLCEQLLRSEEPLLLRLFLCFFSFDKEKSNILRLMMIKENMSELFDLLVTITLDDDCKTLRDQDATYAFLSFLEQLQLKISEGMVLLSWDLNCHKNTLDVNELKECYPQISETTLTFYEIHRVAQRYYTIQHFMEHGNVCYETARNAMDKLVEMKLYKKCKIGKKFVYFIE